ncbi:MAG: hypothetical protein HFG20_06140 [Anaerotruncus sp.]|nr:hypothetical protein [Anaerotruncus sp.]
MGLFQFWKPKEVAQTGPVTTGQPAVASAQPSEVENTLSSTAVLSAQPDPFTAHVVQIAEQFVLDIQSHSQFDFSVESLTLVDELLRKAAELPENPTLIKNLTNCVGCYIFEVARRNYGGLYYWYSPYNQPVLVTGQPDFEASILAFEKVKERLQGEYAHDISFFFQRFVHAVERGRNEPGYRMMVL